MALIVGTNSYVSVEEAEEYFSTRIDSQWANVDEEDQESALVTATQLIDENQFVGVAISSTQSLAWPRAGAVYYDPKYGQWITVPENEYPDRLKIAVYEMANHLINNQNLLDNTAQTFERIKVGDIELNDSSEYRPPPSISSVAKKMLRPLLKVGTANNMWWRAN